MCVRHHFHVTNALTNFFCQTAAGFASAVEERLLVSERRICLIFLVFLVMADGSDIHVALFVGAGTLSSRRSLNGYVQTSML